MARVHKALHESGGGVSLECDGVLDDDAMKARMDEMASSISLINWTGLAGLREFLQGD
jgi:hypothetical protein